MGKGQLGESFFHALAECPLLNTLTVSDASLGSGIQEVTVNHDGLRELQIVPHREATRGAIDEATSQRKL